MPSGDATSAFGVIVALQIFANRLFPCGGTTGGNSANKRPIICPPELRLFQTRKPKGLSARDLGCTKKTVVPREPGRGAASMILKPALCMASNARRAFHPESDVRHAGTAAILIDEFLNRRRGAQRLEQLDQVGAVADLQQGFADLVGAVHFLPVDLAKAESSSFAFTWFSSAPCGTAMAT